MKVAFLLALATAKRVGELQALSSWVAFLGPDLSVSYLPELVVKTESERNPLPRSFLVHFLLEFVGDLPEERFLCPVHAVRKYLDLTKNLTPCPCALFVSPLRLLCAISKNALSFLIRTVIVKARASSEGLSPPRAHSIRGVAMLAAFLKNWLISKVLEVAIWRSNPVSAARFTFVTCRICYMATIPSAHLSRGLGIDSIISGCIHVVFTVCGGGPQHGSMSPPWGCSAWDWH